ncbi:amidohydrolase family protein [Occallatibacter riparius]|uniref:Amidohydrolase n=1 Tax=Occallatibacter riparius TaxID=1002689 RepID=A0A9J7BIR7_9BACT|nr:amidohydrolase [Occallatibacter riparius]UWZ82385.1 amidohydrolase [Occallatibacter riparius]
MKVMGLLIALSFAAGSGAQQSEHDKIASGPFSTDELQSFRAVEPIDTHAHVFAADGFVALLERLNLHILDILVVDDMSPTHKDLSRQRSEAMDVVRASHGYAALCTSFDPYSFNQPGYAKNVIRGLDEDFDNGAIAVKLWKNVGMEIKDANGHYLMADNPVFAPIFQDIAARNKTLVAHLADPDSGWQPPNPASPDYEYYRDHPSAYMYGKKGVPSKEEILRARDHVLEQNPNLRVVGAHLGSMESDLDELGRRLDRYPNFAVDIAARVPYFEMQPRERMIAFITKYQDRLIYGTDVDYAGGAESSLGWIESVYANDWRYFATSDTIEYKGKQVKGLSLPDTVLRKIYHENAVKWFPGIVKPR